MNRLLSFGLAVSATLAVAGTAVAHDAMAMSKPVTVKLSTQNKSGETGTATLMQSGDDVVVKVMLTGGSGEQPDHIHMGSCAKLDPKPAYPLTTVTDGASTTTLKDMKLASLMNGKYAINVHKSTTDLATYVACGNIPAAK